MMTEQSPETVRAALVSMLRRCANYLADLPPDDADALIRGDLELRLSLCAKKTGPPKKARVVMDGNLIAQTLSQLRSINDRQEGERLLKEVAPTKAALEAIARKIDIAVRKGERPDDLVRRIIDSTIGHRLASAAIQGKNPQRDRGAGMASTQGGWTAKEDAGQE